MPKLSPNPAQSKTLRFSIVGMTCASCVNHVQEALQSVEGVYDASVNLATERANIVADATCNPIDFIKAVQQAGYEAHLIQVDSIDVLRSVF